MQELARKARGLSRHEDNKYSAIHSGALWDAPSLCLLKKVLALWVEVSVIKNAFMLYVLVLVVLWREGDEGAMALRRGSCHPLGFIFSMHWCSNHDSVEFFWLQHFFISDWTYIETLGNAFYRMSSRTLEFCSSTHLSSSDFSQSKSHGG